MASITWKNINAPDFRGSQEGLAYASKQFDSAGNALSHLLSKAQEVESANWDNQSRINTEDAIARLRGIADMNAYTEQEGNFDPTVLRETLGRQFNPEQIQAALEKRKNVLTNEAFGGASSTGLDVAKNTMSSAAAAEAVRQSLLTRGVTDPSTVNARVAEFMKNSLAPMEEGWKEQSDQAISRTMLNNLSAPLPTGASAPTASTAAQIPTQIANANPNTGADFNTAVDFILKQEGGYNASDGNTGSPVNMGINQKYHPNVDVKNLTVDQAKSIYKNEYWDAINGDSLPMPTAMVAMDAAVNQGVPYAKRLLKETAGDPAKMIANRNIRYQETALKTPELAKHLPTWQGRLSALDQQLQSVDPEQRVGQNLQEAQAQGIKFTPAQIKTVLESNAALRSGRNSDTDFANSQVKTARENEAYANEKTATAEANRIFDLAATNGGNIREAEATLKGNPLESIIRAKLAPMWANKTKPTEIENVQLESDLQNIAGASKPVLDAHDRAVSTAKLNLDMQDSLKGNNPVLAKAADNAGGLAGVMSDSVQEPGLWNWLIPGTGGTEGVSFKNDVIDTVSELENELRSAGATPAIAQRVILQAIKMSGGPRLGRGGVVGFDVDKIYKNLSPAIDQEQKVGALQGALASAETNKSTAAAQEQALVTRLSNDQKTHFTRNKLMDREYTILPDVADHIKKRIDTATVVPVPDMAAQVKPADKTLWDNLRKLDQKRKGKSQTTQSNLADLSLLN